MSFKMAIHEVNTYLSIEAEGRYRLTDLYDLFDKVITESEKRAYPGVILDVSKIAGTIPLMDMFALDEHYSRVWKLSLRIAIISSEAGVYNFFENVARNRGVQVAVFPNQSTAIGWLTTPRTQC